MKLFDNLIDFNYIHSCENPRYIKGHLVSCGTCYSCLMSKRKQWLTRCNCELRSWNGVGCFLTLTFDDQHLHLQSYENVQKFIRRYKKYFKLDKRHIKYFGAYEKGDLTGRGHYHLVIFGHNPINQFRNYFKTNEIVAKLWKFGLVKVEKLDGNNIQYVCGYVQKKLNYKIAGQNRIQIKYENDQKNKNVFYFMSQSIGYDYFFANHKRFIAYGFIRIGKFKLPIPQAFIDILKKRLKKFNFPFSIVNKVFLFPKIQRFTDKVCKTVSDGIIKFLCIAPTESWSDRYTVSVVNECWNSIVKANAIKRACQGRYRSLKYAYRP